MPELIPTGPYFGWNYTQLKTLLDTRIARQQALAASGGLIGASINGQSFQYASAGSELKTIAGDIANLQDAMAYLRPDLFCPAPSIKTAISFPGSDDYSGRGTNGSCLP